MKKKKITELNIDDFTSILPYHEVKEVLEYYCGKREVTQLENYMVGQTMSMLPQQAGIYIIDLIRFLRYRSRGLKGKKMPLDD